MRKSNWKCGTVFTRGNIFRQGYGQSLFPILSRSNTCNFHLYRYWYIVSRRIDFVKNFTVQSQIFVKSSQAYTAYIMYVIGIQA